jgi:hypothetical protein
MKIATPVIDNPWDRPDFVDEGFDYLINAYGAPVTGAVYYCPCCHYPTLAGRGSFEVCGICYWEDDGQDSHDADRVRGGPNGELSLTEGRANFATLGACSEGAIGRVRPPSDAETRWRRHDD